MHVEVLICKNDNFYVTEMGWLIEVAFVIDRCIRDNRFGSATEVDLPVGSAQSVGCCEAEREWLPWTSKSCYV